MRGKTMFVSVILMTAAMLFVGGCGKQAEPVSAELAETEREVDTEERSASNFSPAALSEESMESSEAPDNSEDKADMENEAVVEDEANVEESISTKTESTKTESADTVNNGSKTNGSATSGESSGSKTNGSATSGESSGSKTNGSATSGASGGSKTNGSATSGASNGSATSDTSSGSRTENVQPADPTPTPATTPTPAPAHTHNWKEHTVTEQVWVPNIVVVDDYEERVVGHVDDVAICNCGYTTTNRDDIVNHIKSNVLAGNEGHGNFTVKPGHDIVEQVKVGSHEEDHGHNETKTYVDYYYCECGETK